MDWIDLHSLFLDLPEERSHHDERPHLEVAVDVVLGRVEDRDDGAYEHPVEGGHSGSRQIERLDSQYLEMTSSFDCFQSFGIAYYKLRK